jgi:hypothetical protein
MIEQIPLPVAPAHAPGGDACACDGRPARYLVDVRTDVARPGGVAAAQIPLCLGCWVDRAGAIVGLVGARRLR